jgi:hypothetical protein
MIAKLALLLIGLFVALTLGNVAILLANAFSRRHSSMVFLFGGFLGAAGFFLTPRLRPYAWLPPLLEPATLAFLFALPRLLNELWQTSRFNLLSQYTGRRGIREVNLCLFRKGVLTLRQSFSRSPEEFGLVESSTIGTWQRKEDRIALRIGEQTAVFEIVPSSGGRTIRQCVGFSSFESDPELSLAAIDLSRDADEHL